MFHMMIFKHGFLKWMDEKPVNTYSTIGLLYLPLTKKLNLQNFELKTKKHQLYYLSIVCTPDHETKSTES